MLSSGSPNSNLYYPGELDGSESWTLKQKHSSLNMLWNSTSSMMHTASAAFHCLIGSGRRASYCGQPDPSIELSPRGNSGSLYLLPTTATSNKSSLSNVSCEEKRRTLTIYDGRAPAAPTAPAPSSIPFELMTPIDAITQTIDDPTESFVQIVLEEPNDRPALIPPLSSARTGSTSRRRRQTVSLNPSLVNERLSTTEKQLSDARSLFVIKPFNSSEIYYQSPEVVEPMDFSFLEPILRDESAALPPLPVRNSQEISSQDTSTNDSSATETRSSPHTITISKDDDLALPSLSFGNNYDNYLTTDFIVSSSRLKVSSPID